jgi:hypothetical protein
MDPEESAGSQFMNVQRPRALLIALRWTARAWSLGSIGIVLAFILGEGLDSVTWTLRETALFCCFPLAVLAGLAAAWKWPAAGGAMVILGIVAFYMLHFAFSGRFPSGIAFILIALPGWLFILSSMLAHVTPPPAPQHPT